LFHTGGARGIHPSELSPPGRYPPRFRGEAPTCRFTRRYSRCKSNGPAQRAAASGLSPFRESLAAAAGLVRRPLVAPLGFALLGYAGRGLAGLTPKLLPRASRNRSCDRHRRRPGVSIGLCLAPSASSGKPEVGQSNPCRVLAPVRSRVCGRDATRAMCSPSTASRIAADRPVVFG
jgi:hypothetical protein